MSTNTQNKLKSGNSANSTQKEKLGQNKILGPKEIWVFGVNYRAFDVKDRERFVFSEEDQFDCFRRLQASDLLRSAAIVSTCNRTEFICTGLNTSAEKIPELILEILSEHSGISTSQLARQWYVFSGEAAVRHVFCVACGLDSMVLGEPQILGQLKDSFQIAQHAGMTSPLSTRLFERAFHAAKSVRTQTSIGRSAVSVCYAARELASQIFGDLAECRVMLIGAGEMGQLALRHFRSAGCRKFFIANKSAQRAVELAENIGGVALGLSDIGAYLSEVDIVVGASALSSGAPALLSQTDVQAGISQRTAGPQFFVDLGVPRNFDAEIGELSEVFLYNIDHLSKIIQQNQDSRRLEIEQAMVLLDDEVHRFLRWQNQRRVAPLIQDLRRLAFNAGEIELDKTLKRLTRAGVSAELMPEIENALRDLLRAFERKVLHRPISLLRTSLESDERVEKYFTELLLGGPQEMHEKIQTDDIDRLSSELESISDSNQMDKYAATTPSREARSLRLVRS